MALAGALYLDELSGRGSRRHASAWREGEIWTIADLGSTHGLRMDPAYRAARERVLGVERQRADLDLHARRLGVEVVVAGAAG